MARRRQREETLASACAALLKTLEDDLRKAIGGDAALKAELEAEWKEARANHRTGRSFAAWRDDLVTQVGASWILSCVFVRFCEDNGLVGQPLIAGRTHEDPALDRLRHAREAEQAYYRGHPDHAEREYLRHVFASLRELPGLGPLLDERHALLWRILPRIEGGRALVAYFRRLGDDGQIKWDFTRERLDDTRFLGDLYQDLSESARKNYALLQTPDFVESFILDRTLTPALETFHAEFRTGAFRLIDPTCGSGHFLLGAFGRLVARWQREQPGLDSREVARRALDGVWGVDLNPFAVAISQFRLLVAALGACGVTSLAEAPNFAIHVVAGDSLLHGERFSKVTSNIQQRLDPDDAITHYFRHESRTEVRAVLGRPFHVVVGNPPYITPKDTALREAYRESYGSCHGKYALSVPFMERFVDLAVRGEGSTPAGYVGKITSNSFMKREFGKPLVETYFPRWDLTHVIDTSGAYIPGHGTPTVILFLRNQPPQSKEIRAVLGIRGEPSTPADPAHGRVWSAIVEQIDAPGSESLYVSTEDAERTRYSTHPWCIAGGGASDLKEALDAKADRVVRDLVATIGFGCVTGEDDLFALPKDVLARCGITPLQVRPFGVGDEMRNWEGDTSQEVLFPYSPDIALLGLLDVEGALQHLWCFRTLLGARAVFGGQSYLQAGKAWWEFHQIPPDRYRTPLSIAFAEVATHNHFVLDRGGKVFNRSAPIIKLPPGATEEDHLALLGVLNSSTACFWGRQVCHNKGGGGIGGGIASEGWEQFLVWNASKLVRMPLPTDPPSRYARRLDQLAQQLARLAPNEWLMHEDWTADEAAAIRSDWLETRSTMIALQEELDWSIYEAFGLIDEPLILQGEEPPPIQVGERAFEIIEARLISTGASQTRWFARHEACPVAEAPSRWPAEYRDLVERRIALIEFDRKIRLIEQAANKRRWNVEPWDAQLARALDDAMLERIESLPIWKSDPPRPQTTARLADLLESDERFRTMAELRTGEAAPDLGRLVAGLVTGDAVPFLPVQYLKASGMRKRADWEETWRLQRVEDPFLDRQEAILRAHFGETPAEQKRAREHVATWRTSAALTRDRGIARDSAEWKALETVRAEWRAVDAERVRAIGGDTPPVPPRYTSADFRSGTFWKHRGKLDVPKERFIAYPGLSPDGDETLLVGWAGWDHAQRAGALATLLADRQSAGWGPARLVAIVKGLDELLFWLAKWHAEDERGDLGEAYAQFVDGQLAQLGLTRDEVRAWTPATAGQEVTA